MEVKVSDGNQSWINFRLDAITRVVDAITKAVKADHKLVLPQCSRGRPWLVRWYAKIGRMDVGCLLSDDL